MSQSRSSLFNQSLEQLDLRQFSLPVSPELVTRRSDVEPLETARRIMVTASYGSQVRCALTAALEIEVQGCGATLAEVTQMAKGIAISTGYPTVIISEDGSPRRVAPLRIPVVLPVPFDNSFAARGVIRSFIDALVSPEFGSIRTASESGVNSLVQQYGFAQSARTHVNSFGGTDLVFSNDLSILCSDSFHQLCEALAEKTSLSRIVIAPTREAVISSLERALGNDFPWKISHKSDGEIKVFVDKSYSVQASHFFRRHSSLLEARANAKITVEYGSIAPDRHLVSPILDTPHSDKRFREALREALYLPSPSRPNGSNVIEVTLPYRYSDLHCVSLLEDAIASPDGFVSYRGKPLSPSITTQEYTSRLSVFRDVLMLRELSIEADTSRVTISLLASDTPPDYASLLTAYKVSESTRGVLKGEVVINRPSGLPAYYDFLSQRLGVTGDWQLSLGEDSVRVFSRTPALFSRELQEDFTFVFKKSLTVTRNPAPLGGVTLLPTGAPSTLPSRMATCAFAESLPHITPPGFGANVAVQASGSHLLLFSRHARLPQKYIERSQDNFYGAPIPIVVQEDFEATPVSSPEVIRHMLEEIVPHGVEVGTVVEHTDCFTASLLLANADDIEGSLLDGLAHSMSECCAKPVRFNVLDSPLGMRELLARSGDVASRRFLVRALPMLPGQRENTVADQDTLERAFFECFYVNVPPPRLVSPGTRITPHYYRDLSSIRCISLDPEDASVREDLLSARDIGDDEIEFGIHIINSAVVVPYGSAADLHARRSGNTAIFTLNGAEHVVSLLSREIRREFDFTPNTKRPSFSYRCRCNSYYEVVPGSESIELALVSSADALTHGDLNTFDTSTPTGATLSHLKNFFTKHGSSLVSAGAPSHSIRARDIVAAMMERFNTYASRLLDSARVALPPHPSNSEASYNKFTGPARHFASLLAQRQLDFYLRGQATLSQKEMDQHVKYTGVRADESVAYDFVLRARQLRALHPHSRLIVTRQGKLTVVSGS